MQCWEALRMGTVARATTRRIVSRTEAVPRGVVEIESVGVIVDVVVAR